MDRPRFPKLLIVDLDGTALAKGQEPYARLSDRLSDFFDTLAARGCQWAINSTWDVGGQWHLALVSSVRNKPAYLMGELGLRLAEVKDAALHFVQPYTATMEVAVKAEARQRMLPVIREINARFMAKRMNFYGHLFDISVVDDELAAFNEFIARYREVEGLVTRVGNGTFSAYPTMLGKGHSVRELMRLKGYSPDDIVTAGDEDADISMMAPDITRHPICPANSAPAVKRHVEAAGGIVSAKPYAEGVMDAFSKLCLARGWEPLP
jgi:hydroxymethylpyrimidine pyrophosphatase-like HAD family hydrolase